MIRLEPGAGQAIRSFLAEKGLGRPVRVDLQSSGCCDASLGLSVDTPGESDLIEELDGLTFVMSPETYQLVGEVTISYVNDAGREGFVITSSKPLNEWSGFGVCKIRT